MWKHGREISWKHIVDLYEQHVEGKVFKQAHKLTRNHIELTSFNQMKVNLAAQVFSSSVQESLIYNYGENGEVSETVKFIGHMNKFFDCLKINVRNLNENVRKRIPDLKAYTDVGDVRLRYLRYDFFGYLLDWERNVDVSWPQLTKQGKKRLVLSHQTVLGLRKSVHSITVMTTELIKFLLEKGTPFVLTHNFNQDPIEEHFAHCRHKCGGNSNPTVWDIYS